MYFWSRKRVENSRMKTENSQQFNVIRFSCTLQAAISNDHFLLFYVQLQYIFIVWREKWKYFYFVSPVEWIGWKINREYGEVDTVCLRIRLVHRLIPSHVSVNSFSRIKAFFSALQRSTSSTKSLFLNVDEKPSYIHIKSSPFRYSYTNETEFYLFFLSLSRRQQRAEKMCDFFDSDSKFILIFQTQQRTERKVSRG